jgi:iron-sulfur cluster insertion protein
MSENTAVDTGVTEDLLSFTDAAAIKVKGLIEEEGNPGLLLRVYITGGGCSGFQYGFTFDEAVNDGDTEVSKNGVRLVVDPMSFQYLVGAEIDYKEDLEGARFVIRNPNATTTCGCGSSFSAQVPSIPKGRLRRPFSLRARVRPHLRLHKIVILPGLSTAVYGVNTGVLNE